MPVPDTTVGSERPPSEYPQPATITPADVLVSLWIFAEVLLSGLAARCEGALNGLNMGFDDLRLFNQQLITLRSPVDVVWG